MTFRFWGIIVVKFLEVIELNFINEFKSSALLSIDITFEMLGFTLVGSLTQEGKCGC